MINVLYLNNVFTGGGAEQITYQLYSGIQDDTFQTYMLVGYGEKNDTQNKYGYSVVNPAGFWRNVAILNGVLHNNAILRSARFRKCVADLIKQFHIDIIHVNNAHGNYMGIEDFGYLSSQCKVIWTLHDMWAVTGHCAHAFDCDQWKSGNCSTCANKRTYPAFYYNNIRKIYEKKREYFVGRGITFVVPSQWLYNVCSESYLKAEDIRIIYNGIDIKSFCVYNKNIVRKQYGIDASKRLIMFASANINSEYKGMKKLVDALNALTNKERYELIIVGGGSVGEVLDKDFTIKKFGYVQDKKVLNALYSAADLFVLPSMADTFPGTAIEALASGTPVAGFQTGGIPEIIGDDAGWLVPRGNVSALSSLIEELFGASSLEVVREKLEKTGAIGRKRVEQNFTVEMMLQKYKKLYREVES